MSKKILSIALALCLVLSCFAVSAFALGSMGYEELTEDGVTVDGYEQSWELSVPVDNGDGTWSVDVILATNYLVGPIQFMVNNTDNANVVLSEFIVNEVSADNADGVIPENWLVDVALSNETGIVALIPNPEVDAVDAIDCTDGVVIGTLVYTVAGEASATIGIANDAKNAENPGGSLIAARMSDGNVVTGTAIVGQDVISVGSDRVIGAAQPAAEPVITGVDTGVVDGTNMYLYGVPAGSDPAAYFTVTDGTVEFSGAGTGATATVKNTDGTVFATYTLIIFGDVNGDGSVTAADANIVKLASLGTDIADANYAFAADLNADGSVTAADANIAKLGSLGTDITVNPYA